MALRTIIRIRYKIEIIGLNSIHLDPKNGTLFLPNHPSRLDPLILFSVLWGQFPIRPVLVEYIYRVKYLKPFVKLFNGISIPNFDSGVNQYKVRKTEHAFQQIESSLRLGDGFLFYPAGRLKKTSSEKVIGSSGLYSILKQYPDVNLVLIKSTGLWGSSFSWGFNGTEPDLATSLFNSIKTILKNGIFFVPRRKVSIEFENASSDFPRRGSRLEIGLYLENWYNRKAEPLHHISYKFWEKAPVKLIEEKKEPQSPLKTKPISKKVKENVYKEISKILDQPNLIISPEMNLSTDLGMDSIDIAELFVYLYRTTGINRVSFNGVETVQNLLDLAEGNIAPPLTDPFEFSWPKEQNRPSPQIPKADTIPHAFFDVCKRMGPSIAMADKLYGPITYKKLKKIVLVLAEHFKSLPETSVGVMLPASVGSYIVILALSCAGKIPVMLNWTLGPRSIDQMISLAGINIIISSWNFVDRVSNTDFGLATDRIQFLEDIKSQISLKTKIRGLFTKKPANMNTDDTAVILFTSGTENHPKGVPLSHRNLLSNLSSVFSWVPYFADDVCFSALPPFHSLGFSVTGLYPLLGGVKVVYSADPTDHRTIGEGLSYCKATIYATAPTFLKNLLLNAKPGQLESIRMFFCGGEKTPKEVYESVERVTKARLVEGYGITECSPAVSAGRPGTEQKGVGTLLPSIDAITLSPDSQKLLPEGLEGEIAISGPNVFNGYLGNAPNPFFESNGKKWFRTGDLGYIDPERNLHIIGRIKRFAKIGGEMISLMAIEQALTSELQNSITIELPAFIVCSHELESSKPRLILFSRVSLSTEEANQILRKTGFSPLVKISTTHLVQEFPRMANGKYNYRMLLELIHKT